MSNIYVSYRRADSGPYVGRLCDWLVRDFGKDSVFRDIEAIRPGMDFVEAIESSVGRCDALIAVIGREWLTASDSSGQHRLENENDYVRLEIALALKRWIPVLPVLVAGAAMPSEESLPEDLRRLTRLQAQSLDDGRWDEAMAELMQSLKRQLSSSSGSGGARPDGQLESGRIRNPGSISPNEAALLSLVPGLGQIILGQTWKGAAVLPAVVVLSVPTAGLALLIGWALAGYDAYTIAKRLRAGKSVAQWESFWNTN